MNTENIFIGVIVDLVVHRDARNLNIFLPNIGFEKIVRPKYKYLGFVFLKKTFHLQSRDYLEIPDDPNHATVIEKPSRSIIDN